MEFFEKIVHDRVLTFIKKNTFLINRQSSFRNLFQTTSAVFYVPEIILEQQAFNTVDHKILF